MNDLDSIDPVHLSVSGPAKGQEVHFPGEEYMQQYLKIITDNQGLFTRAQAAQMLGMSVARVGQLVRSGKLRLVSMAIETPAGQLAIDETIPGTDIQAWMEAPKCKGGRPMHRARQPELQAA